MGAGCVVIFLVKPEAVGGELRQIAEQQIQPGDLALDETDRSGNIRQLRNVLRTALALCDGPEITIYDLPEEICAQAPRSEADDSAGSSKETPLSALEMAERETILLNLEKSRWNVTLAARNLKISRNTLYRKMNNLNIRVNKEE